MTTKMSKVEPDVPVHKGGASLLQLALQSKTDVQTIETLCMLQTRAEESLARKAFFAALNRFQSVCPVVRKKGAANFRTKAGVTSYSYAKLEDIAEVIRPHLEETGLTYRFEQEQQDNQIKVVCIVTHEGGHEERTAMSGYADTSGSKNPIQQIGSTMTYLRRYTLTGALGISVADEDDDGHAAAPQRSEPQQPAQQQPAPRQPANITYTPEKFKEMLKGWKASIENKNMTATSLLDYLQSKHVVLTKEQLDEIRKLEVV